MLREGNFGYSQINLVKIGKITGLISIGDHIIFHSNVQKTTIYLGNIQNIHRVMVLLFVPNYSIYASMTLSFTIQRLIYPWPQCIDQPSLTPAPHGNAHRFFPIPFPNTVNTILYGCAKRYTKHSI